MSCMNIVSTQIGCSLLRNISVELYQKINASLRWTRNPCAYWYNYRAPFLVVRLWPSGSLNWFWFRARAGSEGFLSPCRFPRVPQTLHLEKVLSPWEAVLIFNCCSTLWFLFSLNPSYYLNLLISWTFLLYPQQFVFPS